MRFTEFISEAGSPAQQAAIAIAMKKAGKKPKGVAEAVDIGQEWMSDTELDQYVPQQLQQEWRELVGYDRNGNPSALWANLTGGYEPDVNDPQHRALMVKVANKWFASKKIPNVKFFNVKDADDELEWLVQIGAQGVAEGVAETMPMNDAVKVLRQYGADHFKTTSNELHFYKNGRPLSVDLIFNSDATRSVSLSQLNSVARQLKGQGVAEGLPGGFSKSDYMPGPRGINLPSAPTKKFFTDKQKWMQAVDDINSSKYDDNSDYTGVTGRSTVSIDGREWARWSDAQQKGYIDMGSMFEQGVAEGHNDLGREYGGAYVKGRSDDARMTERLTRQAKAAAGKAGKTFSTSAEYRKWHAQQKEKQGVAEEWSKKYKSSINCSHPKGFSQKAHCAGKKKHNESMMMEMVCEDCGMCQTHGDHENLDEACWKGYHKEGNKKMFGKTYPNCVKNEGEESTDQVLENLHKWFKEKWVRFGPDGKIRGDCARGSESEGKPKCLPQSKAHSLGKKGRASAASRKRREDPNANRSGKAINVSTKGKGK